jgi:O-antigen ligase
VSYGARRLNHSNLRPRLQAKKDKRDLVQAEQENELHDEPANQTSILIPPPSASRGEILSQTRLHNPLRPAISNILPLASDAPALEGEELDSQVSDRSSAARWGMLLVILIVLVWGVGFLIGFQVSLAILLGIGLILSVVGLVSPSLGLMAIGMVAALDAMANIFLYTGGLLRYNTLNYFLLFIILLNIPLVLRMNDLSSRTLQIFLLLMTIELTFSKNISNGVQDVLNIGATFGMVVYFARALKDELSIYWLGIVNGVLAGLGGFVFFLQMNQLPYANPNDWTYFSMTALFSICISYPFAVKYHKDRFILLFLAVVNFAWIFLSASRGSLLVAILAGAFLFLSTRSISWKTLMVVIVIGVGVWVSANFAEQQVTTVTRIQELFDPTLSATKRTSKRSVIADAGWQIFQKNPMGIGTGSFEEETTNTGLLGTQRPPHSAWVQVLAENGVLGILFLTAFIGSFALAGFRKNAEGKLLFALFISLVLASAFIAKEFRGKSLWFLAASGIVLLQPKAILAYLNREGKQRSLRDSKQIRKVRFGRRR